MQAERRQRRREGDRDELLAAAERVFSARGYAGASIRDIAADAGFSVGGVYQFFPGKQELFAAVWTACGRNTSAVTRAALARPAFAERLSAFTRASGEFVAARRSFLAIVLSRSDHGHPRARRQAGAAPARPAPSGGRADEKRVGRRRAPLRRCGVSCVVLPRALDRVPDRRAGWWTRASSARRRGVALLQGRLDCHVIPRRTSR